MIENPGARARHLLANRKITGSRRQMARVSSPSWPAGLKYFKVLVMDAGRTWLKPLNPQHPPILEAFRVMGNVIRKWEEE